MWFGIQNLRGNKTIFITRNRIYLSHKTVPIYLSKFYFTKLLLSIVAVDLVLTFVKSITATKNKISNSLVETLYLQQRVSVSAQFDCLGGRVQNKKGPKSQKTKNYQFAVFDLKK